MVENVMEEEDIEECIKKVNAIDNGIQLFIQNISQNFEKFKNLKKRYLDKLVDYKVFLGDCDNKKDKEKRFREVEDVSKEFKTSVKSFIEYDEGTKNFIRTIDKENEALTKQKVKGVYQIIGYLFTSGNYLTALFFIKSPII